MVMIEFCKLLVLSLLFSGCRSSGSGSIDSHHRKLRRCSDLDSFSNNDIEDLSRSDKDFYMDECIYCEDINENLDNNRKSWFYSKCIDCDVAEDMRSSEINNLARTVEEWYGKRCGSDIFKDNAVEFLTCDDIYDLDNQDFDLLTDNEREYYKEECISCSTWEDMSYSKQRDIESDDILRWFREKCEDSDSDNESDSDSSDTLHCYDLLTMNDDEENDLSTTIRAAYSNSCVSCSKFEKWTSNEQSNLYNNVWYWYYEEGCINYIPSSRYSDNLRCNTFFVLSYIGIQVLPTSDRIWYRNNCIDCNDYDDYSRDERTDLNTQVTEMYKDEGCIDSNSDSDSSDDRTCSNFFDLSSLQISLLDDSDEDWYQRYCIHCDEYDNMSSRDKEDLNSQIIEMYEKEGCIDSSSDSSLDIRFISCDIPVYGMTVEELLYFSSMCDRDFERRPYNAFTARTADGCVGCADSANTFSNCVNDCPSRKEYCFAEFEDMPDLASCCEMSTTCKLRAIDVEACFDECLPECVEDTANNYLECMVWESYIGSGCNREDCFSQILLDRDWVDDDTLDSSDNFFDNLGDRLDDIRDDSNDINSCDGAEYKAAEVCDINSSCCSECDEELSEAMDCVVNKVMRPILGVTDLNNDCETDCKDLLDRRLQSLQEDASNAVSFTTTTKAAESNLSTDLEQSDYINDDGNIVTVLVESATNEKGEKVTTLTQTTSITKTTTTNIVEVYTTKEISDGDNTTTISATDPIITSTVISTTTTAAETETPPSSGTMEINDDDSINITALTDDLFDFGEDFVAMKEKVELEDIPSPAKECKSQLVAGLALGNATQSSTRFLNCLIEKGTGNMVDSTEKEKEEPKPSSAISRTHTGRVTLLVVASLSILLTWL